MPTYIIAYCYVELLDFAGPMQRLLRTAVRLAFTVQDYWFPEVRSLPGAILRSVRCALSVRVPVGAGELRAAVDLRAGGGAHAGSHLRGRVLVGRAAAGAARSCGGRCAGADGMPQRSRRRAIPGRADADGQHLRDLAAALEPGRRGADCSGSAVCSCWRCCWQREPRAAAAQFHHTTGRYRSIPFSDLDGWRGYAAAALCCLPALAGFVAPFAVLLWQALPTPPTVWPRSSGRHPQQRRHCRRGGGGDGCCWG